MTAETIAKALGGHARAQHGWRAARRMRIASPSLSISAGKDGKVLVRCHAGCDQRDVIAALRERGLWRNDRASFWAIARNRRGRLPTNPMPTP